MKVKVSALREMIARMVREEVARALDECLDRRLTEALARNYVREIVAEAVGPGVTRAPARVAPRPASSIVSELVRKHGVLDDDEDAELPRSVSPLLERNNPLRGIYEGTEPLPEDNARQPGDFDVPIDMVGFADPSVLKRMAGL